MLSLQASYAAPLILLAQNRQTDRDRVQAEQDRQRSERNLADTEFLAREMAALRIALSEVATRDFVRSELRNLLEDLAAERDGDREHDDDRPEGAEEGRPHSWRRRPAGTRLTAGQPPDLRWAHARAHRPADSTPSVTALTRVLDPEIKRPITDLGMVRSVEVAGCPGDGRHRPDHAGLPAQGHADPGRHRGGRDRRGRSTTSTSCSA